MERLMKSLTDEVLNTEEVVSQALAAETRADRASARALVDVGFSKIHAHIMELRQRLGL